MVNAEVKEEEELVPTKVKKYILTLSEFEAASLVGILGQISGSSHNSPRGHTSGIYNALTRLGVYYSPVESSLFSITEDRIWAEDYSDEHEDRKPK
jgi:hypothetical protein